MTSENKLNNAKVTQSDPSELQLFPHNEKAYLAVQEAFSSGMLRCCVVHPTGTGKAYIALSVIRDHPDATILYVTSTVANMEYFYHLVEDSLHIDLPDSMILMTIYQNLGQKISSFDYIILDEFHRAGAPTWSKYVHDLIAQNPEAKVLGLSATPIRYLDDYRNMAEDLFDGNVVSEITLQDAIVEGLLPAPRYVTSLYSYKETADQIENVLNTPGAVRDPSEARRILSIVRRIIETIGGVDQLLKKHIPCTPGKYIVFCKNLTHLLSLSQVIPDWFAFTGLPVKLYRLHSGNPNTDVLSAFENDPAPGIQILLCINMLNEGIHLSHLSGIILARPTESPIIYFQQIGRALSVSSKGTPLIIDLVDNINQINMSKGFWNGVLNDMQRKDMPITGIFNVFGREFELLEYLNQFEKYVWSNWDCYYEICRKYYVDHGDLNIPSNYIVDGHYIASWLSRQRRCYNGLESPMLSEDQITRLNQIGMAWSCPRKNTWEENYPIARQYYEEYHDLLPPRHFIYHGLHLWAWLSVVRSRYNAGNLSEDKISLLNEIGMVWKLSTSRPWAEAFQVLLQFKETNGHCNVPVDYVIDGFNLYHWCLRQRHAHTMGTLPEGRMIQLESIGFVWKQRKTFAEMYEIAKEFYMEHGHLLPQPNQFYHGVNLGHWLIIQRYRKSSTRDNRLKEEQVKKLDEIGMYWHTQTIRNHARWMKH
ncbi:MAG: Helicase associated domain protein, partial [Clostridia bacterium]|nr:Helicase associated domain protein [Clostridia bacterium]